MVLAIRGLATTIWAFFITALYGTAHMVASVLRLPITFTIERAWCKQLLAFGGVKVEVEGEEHIQFGKSYVFYSNHASALDIPILISAVPTVLRFMAKKELFYIPLFGWAIRVAGHLPVDRSSARKAIKSIGVAAEKLKNSNISIILFPEGTRSATGEIADFKPAAFALALEAGVDVVPVYLHGSNKILPKNAWFIHPGTVHVCIGEPHQLQGKEYDKKQLSGLVRERVVKMRQECEAGEKN